MQAEQLARPSVHQHDGSRQVDDEHAFDHAAQDGLEALALDVQRGDRPEDTARHAAEPVLDRAQRVGPFGGQVRHRRPFLELHREAGQAVETTLPAERQCPRREQPDGQPGGRHEDPRLGAAGEVVRHAHGQARTERRQRRQDQLGRELTRRARRG